MRTIPFIGIFVTALVAALTVSCGGSWTDPDDGPRDKETIIDTTVILAYSGGTGRVSFTTRSKWEAELGPGGEWCSIAPASGGSGNSTIIISSGNNSDLVTRSARIVIKSRHGSGIINVIQQQQDVLDISLDTSCDFGPEGGSFAVKLDHNVDYTVNCSSDWVRPASTKALQHSVVSFEVGRNDTGQSRSAAVTFSATDISHTLTIDQQAAYLSLSEKNVRLGAARQTLGADVSSNVPYAVSMPEYDWLSLMSEASGGQAGVTSSSRFEFALAENPGYLVREARVAFGNPDYKLSDTLYVLQKAVDILTKELLPLEFGPEGGSFAFDIDPDADYSLSADCGWLSILSDRQAPLRRTISVPGNFSGEDRLGSVTVSDGERSNRLDFTQEAARIDVSARELEFTTAGGVRNLTTGGNIDYKLIPPEDAAWCMVTPASEEEEGVYSVSVEENPSEAPRSCTFSFESEKYGVKLAITVKQAQKDAFVLSPADFAFGPEGGLAEISIHSNVEFECKMDNLGDWVTEDILSRSDSKRVYHVAPNTTGVAREGLLLFNSAGIERSISFCQDAASLAVDPGQIVFEQDGGTAGLIVRSNVPISIFCENAPWLSISQGTNGNWTITARANTQLEERLATVTVTTGDYGRSQDIKISQPAPEIFLLRTKTLELGPGEGLATVDLVTNLEYICETDSDWIKITDGLSFAVERNTSDSRTGHIVFTCKGKKHTVTLYQEGPRLAPDTETISFSTEGGKARFAVEANIAYRIIAPEEDWVVLSSLADGSVTVEVSPNPLFDDRECHIDIVNPDFDIDRKIHIHQTREAFFELTPASVSLGPAASRASVHINTNTNYSCSIPADWVTDSGGGNFEIKDNTTGLERSCEITYSAGGKDYSLSITQAAAFLELNTSRLDFGREGGTSQIKVETNVPVDIKKADDAGWLSIAEDDNHLYTVAAAENSLTQARECQVVIYNDLFGLEAAVAVRQEHADMFELLTGDVTLGPKSGEFEVELKANMEYSCTCSEDWLRETSPLIFLADDNTGGQERSCTIDFLAGENVYSINVIQAAPYLSVSPSEFKLDSTGGVISIAAETNLELSVASDGVGWLENVLVQDGNYQFEVAESTAYDTRSCNIVFASADFGLERAVSVTQTGRINPFVVNGRDLFVGPCGGQVSISHSACSSVEVTTFGNDWIREEPGLRNDTLLVFSADTLYSSDSRQASFSIKGNGKTRTVYVFQNPPMLMLLDDKRTFQPEGGSSSIGIKSNMPVHIYTEADWVSSELNEAGDRIAFTVKPNDTGRERSAVIEIGVRELGCVKYATVTQRPVSIIKVIPESCAIGGAGGDYPFIVDANVEFTFNSAASWITCSPGEDEGSFVLKVQPNPSPYGRVSRVMFSSGTVNAFFEVQQEGTRNPDYYYSEDFSRNGKVTRLQKASVGAGIPLILMGDAYSDRLIEDGTYASDINRAVEAFFAIEPFASFRQMFDVYMIDVVSINEIYADDASTALSTRYKTGELASGDDYAVYSLASGIVDSAAMKNTLMIVLLNMKEYGGTTYLSFYNTVTDYGMGRAIAYIPLCTSSEQFAAVVQHEAGGHGFGKLEDEYAYRSNGEIPAETAKSIRARQATGFYKNVDFTPDPQEVLWRAFLADERYRYDGLGVFEGACTFFTGAYRPTEESMMYHLEGPFNAPSREAIYYRLHKLAFGLEWEYDREAFIEYDTVNRRSTPKASPAARQSNTGADARRPLCPYPLPHPVIVKQ